MLPPPGVLLPPRDTVPPDEFPTGPLADPGVNPRHPPPPPLPFCPAPRLAVVPGLDTAPPADPANPRAPPPPPDVDVDAPPLDGFMRCQPPPAAGPVDPAAVEPPKLLRPANRVLADCGIPAVFTGRCDMRMLSAPGVTGIRP